MAPNLFATDGISANRLPLLRSELLQRFTFLLLQDASHASKYGIYIENELVFLRLNTLVADWKQERAFFSLKSSSSFADCSNCTCPTRPVSNSFTQRLSAEDIHRVQLN